MCCPSEMCAVNCRPSVHSIVMLLRLIRRTIRKRPPHLQCHPSIMQISIHSFVAVRFKIEQQKEFVFFFFSYAKLPIKVNSQKHVHCFCIAFKNYCFAFGQNEQQQNGLPAWHLPIIRNSVPKRPIRKCVLYNYGLQHQHHRGQPTTPIRRRQETAIAEPNTHNEHISTEKREKTERKKNNVMRKWAHFKCRKQCVHTQALCIGDCAEPKLTANRIFINKLMKN